MKGNLAPTGSHGRGRILRRLGKGGLIYLRPPTFAPPGTPFPFENLPIEKKVLSWTAASILSTFSGILPNFDQSVECIFAATAYMHIPWQGL